jgi:hypothetical protein
MTRCHRLFLIALLLLTTALTVQAQDDPVGAWEWIGTDLPGGGYETPATTGHAMRREFTSPNLYTHFVDGTPVETGTFLIYEYPGENDWWMLDIDTPQRDETWIFVKDGSTALHLLTDAGGFITEPREHYLSVDPVDAQEASWGEVKGSYR